MNIAFVLGTRPELIKLAHIIEQLGDEAVVMHTGQHYSPELAKELLGELRLDAPSVQLAVGGTSRGAQIGEAITALDGALATSDVDAVVVQGDTNAALAGALAANARTLPLVHVEAGLRSFDRAMPEEHNRVLVDHLSDLLLAPTEVSRANLLAESIPTSRIVVTGNTVVDAVTAALPTAAERRGVLDHHGVEPNRFVLATFHRPENVDDPARFEAILRELVELPLPVVLPLHPRSVARAQAAGLQDLLQRLMVGPPAGYRTFLALAAESACLISDSGGVQEEASVVKRPVIVVRNSTERPEVLGTFAALVTPGPAIGEQARAWLSDLDALHARLGALPSPYGDGTASARSVEAIRRLVRETT